ncbi:hypothetical protein COOONC_21866 [Cooperia oncophora]
MAINVVQMQLEILFGKFVKSIDNDFKINLLSSEDEAQPVKVDIETCRPSLDPIKKEDVVKQYGENMRGSDRLLMQFLSHHQYVLLFLLKYLSTIICN